MNIIEIQKAIDELYYWDTRAVSLSCNYFADEITLAYEDVDDDNIDDVIEFTGCYRSVFDHVKHYDKLRPAKEMSRRQIPYFLLEIKIGQASEKGVDFYTCNIDMFPLDLEIWCKDIKVSKRERGVR